MKKTQFIVGLVTVVALWSFVTTLTHAVAYDPSTASETPATTTKTIPGNYPERLVVPTLSINAAVQYTTITARGTMGTPTNFTDVAWYEYGAVPGNAGEAIIDGHVDNGLNLAGVFKHLNNIKNGDDIYVIERDGTELHFIVSSVASYDYGLMPMNNIISETGPARLALITCEGDWISSENMYSERLVVTADLAGVIKTSLQ